MIDQEFLINANIVDLLDDEDSQQNINSTVFFEFNELTKAKSTMVRLSYLPNEKANVAFFTLEYLGIFEILLTMRDS